MARPGEAHHNATLTEAKVRAIRRLHFDRAWKVNCIATAYGLSYQTVYDVVNYVTWKHVDDTRTGASN